MGIERDSINRQFQLGCISSYSSLSAGCQNGALTDFVDSYKITPTRLALLPPTGVDFN